MVREILTYPHESLRRPTKPWRLSDELEPLVQDMHDSLEALDHGAALAANQIGVGSRIFVINRSLKDAFGQEHAGFPRAIVNPQVEEIDPETRTEQEGCLSFPGIDVPIKRSVQLTVSFDRWVEGPGWDREGWIRQRWVVWDFMARVFQHEIDHLDGKLFVDYLDHRRKFKIREQMLKRGKRARTS